MLTIGGILLLALLPMLFLAYRWQVIIKALDMDATSRDALRFTFIGIFFT